MRPTIWVALTLIGAYLIGYFFISGLYPDSAPSTVGLTISFAAMPGLAVGLYAGRF